MNIGITGQNGFIGTNLFNFLLTKENIKIIPFEREFMNYGLDEFITKCDIIIHCAALIKCKDQQLLYDANMGITINLFSVLEKSKNKPHLIFTSSINDNGLHGKYKTDADKLFSKYSGKYTCLKLPNIFGQFCRPFYNSVIATFCYQLTHDGSPVIIEDKMIPFVYVGDLCELIYSLINDDIKKENSFNINVSDVLKYLKYYQELYLYNGIIPELKNNFELNLFNTFRSYMDIIAIPLNENTDERGGLSEILKTNIGGQVFYSTTKPGMKRGEHFHIKKFERFIIINGSAIINLRRIDNIEIIKLEIKSPAYIDIPIYYTHNIINIGDSDLLCVFYSNEFYDKNNPDTYKMNVNNAE